MFPHNNQPTIKFSSQYVRCKMLSRNWVKSFSNTLQTIICLFKNEFETRISSIELNLLLICTMQMKCKYAITIATTITIMYSDYIDAETHT